MLLPEPTGDSCELTNVCKASPGAYGSDVICCVAVVACCGALESYPARLYGYWAAFEWTGTTGIVGTAPGTTGTGGACETDENADAPKELNVEMFELFESKALNSIQIFPNFF